MALIFPHEFIAKTAIHSIKAAVARELVIKGMTQREIADLLESQTSTISQYIGGQRGSSYDLSEEVSPIKEQNLLHVKPLIVKEGKDITLVGAGYMTSICMNAHNELLKDHSISSEVIDLRVINPLNINPIL